MPCHPNDTNFTEKKKHIGNDNVTIVYNDSGEEYRMGTIKVSSVALFRLRNDLYCVGWGVKLYSLTHSVAL